MAIQSPDDFFSILEKSNLLDAEQILAARQSVQGLDDAALVARQLARDGILTRWQAAQLLAGRSSFLLGKYKLIDLLGRGGMGRVFLGRHVTMRRPVALKIVSREVCSNPAALERFLAEARAIAALDHPAIVQAYSVDCEGDRYYIVMEYVDGRDLQRVVEEVGPLDCRTAVEYIRQAADGLAHAHGRNLVHCDIKPSNLLVNSQGQVKILDMGMARLGGCDDEGDAPDGNHILGSVDYLAPEQALGSENFDHRADIYALGCTLYFLLTGHPPFPEGTLPERILKHQTQQPRPIPTERPDVPPQLVQVCRRMMAKRPEERFQSAAEIVTALAEVSVDARDPVRAAAAAGARPAPVPDLQGEPADRAEAADAHAPGSDPIDWARTAIATTVGRVVLGGIAALALLVVVGISMVIVAVTSSSRQHEIPGEIATAEPERTSKEEHKQEEEKEEYESELERAFALRLKEVEEAEAAAEFDKEQAAAAEQQTEPPSQPEQAAPKPVPPDDASPEEPSGDETDEPASEKPPGDEPGDTKPDKPGEAPKPKSGTSDSDTKRKPAEKPKPQNPLRDIGKIIALAEGAAPGTVTSLGRLHLPDGTALQMELLGGETAMRGNRQYLIETEMPQSGTLQWDIKLQADLPGKPKAVVELARLGVAEKEKELRIEWLPGSNAESVQCLRNCVLALRANDNTAWIGFGEPESADPVVLDFAKRTSQGRLTSDALPETDSLAIQVTRIEGNVPKIEFKPADTVKEGERMEIQLAKPKAALVNLQFRFTVRGREVRVEAMPMFSLDGVGQRPLVPRETQRVGSQLLAQRAALETMLRSLPERDRNRAKIAKQKSELDKAIARLAGLAELYAELNEQAKIHYRVFTKAGEREVDLWTTEVKENDAAVADPAARQNARFVRSISAIPVLQTSSIPGGL